MWNCCQNLRLKNIGRNFTGGSDNLDNITFVSIHVRRTDYAHHMSVLYNMTYVEDSYFSHAIQYFKNKFDVRIFFKLLMKQKEKLFPLHIF